jgi:beta-hydroxylase
MNDVFYWAEAKGYFPRAPAFMTDFHKDYPQFKLLEDNYETVRDECKKLLGVKDQIADIEVLGGGYTEGGIHSIKWKSFMFKSGDFLEENCKHAPKTTEILRQMPGIYTVFFSIIDPKQYVTPHWGYYKGFLRYHLGVIIPNNNANDECWLRVNTEEPREITGDERKFIDQGEKYYWHNGEGVIFDDAYLHDAKNDSDEVRVVMWIDVRRKMPWWLQAFGIAEREVFRAPREPAFDLACGVGFSANVLVLFLLDACVLPPQRGQVS